MGLSMRQPMRLLKLDKFPIMKQLQLEERLMRTRQDNWCIFNNGTAPPAIVMGVTGNANELLNVDAVSESRVPVVRRFSGGGTVIVDENTLFVTLICSKEALPSLQIFPIPIMRWGGELYEMVFKSVPGFRFRDNDYVFGDRKVAGIAASLTKDRWVHHTSFLWDYDLERMNLLKMPSRTPAYRLGRSHADFICKLKDFMSSREEFVENLETGLSHYFEVEQVKLEDVTCSEYPHATKLVDLNEAA